MYYLIKQGLKQTDTVSENDTYAAIFTPQEWSSRKESEAVYGDIGILSDAIFDSKAEVSLEHLSGTFCIPERSDLSVNRCFYFIIDEDSITFIDESGYVHEAIAYISRNKKWKEPSLARFIYDLLDYILKDDLKIMEDYERELELIEDEVDVEDPSPNERLMEIRNDIRAFYLHYEQLLFVAQEFEENENEFFEDEQLRYFHSFANRVERLLKTSGSVRDHILQIEEIINEQIGIKQNSIMTVLTVVTTIFMPLTLIAGWYGMNFRYMPELEYRFSYPILTVICILIVIVMLYYFNRKKWL